MSVYTLHEEWTPIKEKKGILRNTSTCNMEYAITDGAEPTGGAVLVQNDKVSFDLTIQRKPFQPWPHPHHHHHREDAQMKTLFIRCVGVADDMTYQVVVDNVERDNHVNYDVFGLVNWCPGRLYVKNQYATNEDHLYRCLVEHTSGDEFEKDKWQMIASDTFKLDTLNDKIFVTDAVGEVSTFIVNNVAMALAAQTDSDGNVIKDTYATKEEAKVISKSIAGNNAITRNLQDGQTLVWNEALGSWVNQLPPALPGATSDLVIQKDGETVDTYNGSQSVVIDITADAKAYTDEVAKGLVKPIDVTEEIADSISAHNNAPSAHSVIISAHNEDVTAHSNGLENPLRLWSAGTTYAANNVVVQDKKIWMCVTPNSDAEFDKAKWQSLGINADDLAGKADTDLSNIDSNIDYVVDSYFDNDGNWWRKYKSGWVEQGGRIAGVDTDVSFLKPYIIKPSVLTHYESLTNTGAVTSDYSIPYDVTLTGFKTPKNTTSSASNYPKIWRAEGQGAIE